MFDEKIHNWLLELTLTNADEWLSSHRLDIINDFKLLGISEDSQIVEFYTKYGAYRYRGWYELISSSEIKENSVYLQEDFDIPEKFVGISSFEGGGFILYDKLTGCVYDLTTDQIVNLLSDKLKPVAKDFASFVVWAKNSNQNS